MCHNLLYLLFCLSLPNSDLITLYRKYSVSLQSPLSQIQQHPPLWKDVKKRVKRCTHAYSAAFCTHRRQRQSPAFACLTAKTKFRHPFIKSAIGLKNLGKMIFLIYIPIWNKIIKIINPIKHLFYHLL